MSPLFVATVRKDLLLHLREPFTLVLWLAIPLLLGGLMSLVTGGGGSPKPHGKLYLADEDQSLLSRAVGMSFSSGPLSELFEVEKLSLEEAKNALRAGDGSAALRIPKDFGKKVLLNEPCRLTLIRNPSQTILPSIAEETLRLLTEAEFYLQEIAGPSLRPVIQSTIAQDEKGTRGSLAEYRATSLAIGNTMQKLERYLFPPVLEIVPEPVKIAGGAQETKKKPKKPFSLLYLPGLLLMALFFMAQGLGEDLWHERGARTLHRLASSEAPLSVFLAGKLTAAVVLMGACCAIVLGIGMAWHALPISRFPLSFLFALLSGLSLYLLLLLIQSLASTQRGGSLLTSFLVFPLLMIGGCFFPFAMLPRWMREIGQWTPNGYAALRLDDLLNGQANAKSLMVGALFLLLVSVLCFLFVHLRVRRKWVAS